MVYCSLLKFTCGTRLSLVLPKCNNTCKTMIWPPSEHHYRKFRLSSCNLDLPIQKPWEDNYNYIMFGQGIGVLTWAWQRNTYTGINISYLLNIWPHKHTIDDNPHIFTNNVLKLSTTIILSESEKWPMLLGRGIGAITYCTTVHVKA